MLRPIVDRMPRVASLYRTIRDEKETSKPPVMTSLGFRMSGNDGMASGAFEPDETALIQFVLGRAETFVNIGANIGYYCLLARKLQKHVIAFEPFPSNVKMLLKNLDLNGYCEGTEVYPVALSNHPNVLKIYGGGTGASLVEGWAGAAASFCTLVPVSTLDLILSDRMSRKRCLIVLDVEGAERFVLQGANSLLTGAIKPVWIVEISSTEHQPKGIEINPHFLSTFKVFWDAGYMCFTANRDLRKVEFLEIEKIQSTGSDTLGTHNFVFLHPSESYISIDEIRSCYAS